MDRQRKIVVLVIPFIVALLALVLACGIISVAIQQRSITPPEINITIAGMGIVANTTTVPSCAIWFIPCEVSHLRQEEDAYAIWVIWKPVRSPTQQLGAKRLFMIRIQPGSSP